MVFITNRRSDARVFLNSHAKYCLYIVHLLNLLYTTNDNDSPVEQHHVHKVGDQAQIQTYQLKYDAELVWLGTPFAFQHGET